MSSKLKTLCNMMRGAKSIHAYFLACFLGTICCFLNLLSVSNAQEQNQYTVVWQDDFKNFTKRKINTSAIESLEKRGFDINQLENVAQPKNWDIDWNSVEKNSRCEERNGKWTIQTGNELQINGPYLSPKSQNCQLELTFSALSEPGKNPNVVEIGIHEYGLQIAGQRFFEKITLSPNEKKKISVKWKFEHDYPSGYRPILRVTGNIQLEHIAVFADLEQLKRDKLTLLEGTLTELSAIPDPKKSDYPNCRFTAHLVGNSILNGISSPKEVNLVIEGFKDYKELNTKTLKQGEQVRVLMMPFEAMDENQKSTQQADDLNLFNLETYYCIGISKQKNFTDTEEFSESDIYFFNQVIKYTSAFERHVNPPISKELADAQKKAISDDLATMNELLAPYTEEKKAEINKAFKLAWEKEKDKDKPDYNRIKNYVWRNVDNSFWCLPQSFTFISQYTPVAEDKMEALVALRDFLEANGCQLIVALVPNLYDIAARVINKDFRHIPDFSTACIVKQFLEAGVETVYASEAIIKNYNRYSHAFFYPNNPHPMDTTQEVMAEILAEKLTRYPIKHDLEQSKFSTEPANHIIYKMDDYFYPSNCDIGGNQVGTAFPCMEILYDGKLVQPKENCEIAFLGNSFMVFPHVVQNSASAFLSYKTKASVSAYSLGNDGPMTTLLMYMLENPKKYLKGHKVMILYLGIGHIKNPVLFFYNIREMDRMRVALSGKKAIQTIPLAGKTESSSYKGAKEVSLHRVEKDGDNVLIRIINSENGHWDKGKEVFVGINGWLMHNQDVSVYINDIQIKITTASTLESGRNNLSLVTLPAGTESITVTLRGKADHEISLKDIQLFQ